jgi:hypothetical protein
VTSRTEALAALAAAPDRIANCLGFHRHHDGTIGDPITRDEWRQALVDGEIDPEPFLRNLRLVERVQSDPEFHRELAAVKTEGQAERPLRSVNPT